MRKGLVTKLVGGVALTTLVLQGAHREPSIEDYRSNSYCIRQSILMTNQLSKETQTATSYGTAFILDTDTRTYFITNKHVINLDTEGKPDYVTIDKIVYDIVDNANDKNDKDDLRLKLVAVSNDSDTALLVYDKPLAYQKVTHDKKPTCGVKVFGYGFPLGLAKVYHEGKLGVPESVMIEQFKDVYINTNGVVPGDSGSPVYTMDGNHVKLLGYVVAMIHSLSAVVPIKYADELLSKYRASPFQERKNLEKTLAPIYPSLK